jgi:hypothetical protein
MGTTAGRGDQLDLEVEPLAPLHDAPHLEALQTDEAAKVILHPPFLLAPRSMTTQSLVKAADASCQTPYGVRAARDGVRAWEPGGVGMALCPLSFLMIWGVLPPVSSGAPDR